MVMDDFHASPLEAGLTLCFKSKYWSRHQHVVASPSSQATDGGLRGGFLRFVLAGGNFHLCEPVPRGRPVSTLCRGPGQCVYGLSRGCFGDPTGWPFYRPFGFHEIASGGASPICQSATIGTIAKTVTEGRSLAVSLPMLHLEHALLAQPVGNADQPTHRLALCHNCIHGLNADGSPWVQLICMLRNTRSGCGIMAVKRPSAVVTAVRPPGLPFGLNG
jgi:hypothetical protein